MHVCLCKRCCRGYQNLGHLTKISNMHQFVTLLPQILTMLNTPFEAVNILEDESLRSGMKEFSQWPTFPQVYIHGEFYGGCDIMIGEQPSTPPEARSSLRRSILKERQL